jgi:Na+-transporting NADH:ubiquinone oxidoreductase subunit C
LSAVISTLAVGLSAKKELNVSLDRKKKILNALGLEEKVAGLKSAHDILDLYNHSVTSIVVNPEGDVLEGRNDESIQESEADSAFPVYLLVQEKKVQALAVPVSGKGLWSTLYGFLALENDLNTVRGITFYKHGETPGLGGEIEKPWFQDNFIGKKIFDNSGDLVSIKVIKGKVAEMINDPEEISHSVDGISGATITSKGVTALLIKWLNAYLPFFNKAKTSGLDNLL